MSDLPEWALAKAGQASRRFFLWGNAKDGGPRTNKFLSDAERVVAAAFADTAREAREQAIREALAILHDEGWLGRSEQRIASLIEPMPEGEVVAANKPPRPAEDVRGWPGAAPGQYDYIYDPDDWEITYNATDRYMLFDDHQLRFGEIKQFATLIKGAPVWAACVVIGLDDEGEPEESEIRWFNSEEEARAAVEALPPLPRPPAPPAERECHDD
ncbi:MAG TPA: hypothetical protein VFA12_20650 [Stellaceae bacterium]|nr:hypothetical protein [Stellaceae bacterium]